MRVRALQAPAGRTAGCPMPPTSRPTLGYLLVRRGHCAGSSAARALLASGRVSVNGEVEHSFARKIAADFEICVRPEGQPPPAADDDDDAAPYLVVWCKPCGIVCSMDDDCGRDDLRDAIAPELARPGLHVVGRLDRHSCGLMLWTTDGRLTRALLDPACAVPRQ